MQKVEKTAQDAKAYNANREGAFQSQDRSREGFLKSFLKSSHLRRPAGEMGLSTRAKLSAWEQILTS